MMDFIQMRVRIILMYFNLFIYLFVCFLCTYIESHLKNGLVPYSYVGGT